MAHIINIAGYQFVSLEATELAVLRNQWLDKCGMLGLMGTILLSEEGVNVFLAGVAPAIDAFIEFLSADARFSAIRFTRSVSTVMPFKRMKVKIKKEIITLRQPSVQPCIERAASLDPLDLKQWLDEQRDFTLLDTRNEYELAYGTFTEAVTLPINDFCEFPKATDQIDRHKPVVMFCTGGIRCEKAALYMQQAGFTNVYQLDGGILNYFAKVGGEHYTGSCFVFDERVALRPDLTVI